MNEALWTAIVLRCVGKSPSSPVLIAAYADELCEQYRERFGAAPAETSAAGAMPLEDYGDIQDQIENLHSNDLGDDE